MEEKSKPVSFWKKHRWDFFLLVGLMALTCSFFAFRFEDDFSSKEEVIAKVYLGNTLQKTINLSNIDEYKEEEIDGLKGKMTLGMRHNQIAVIHSSCPGQECVHEGYVHSNNHPIVCAYNQVLISLSSGSSLPSEVPLG